MPIYENGAINDNSPIRTALIVKKNAELIRTALALNQIICVTLIGLQSKKEISKPDNETTMSVVQVTYSECTFGSNFFRVIRSLAQTSIAAVRGSNIVREKTEDFGLTINNIPINPTRTANHLTIVTCSFNISAAEIVRNIGDVQSNVALIAIGIMVNPVMNNIVAPHSHNALKITHFEKITLEMTGLPLILITNEKIAIAIMPLMNSI